MSTISILQESSFRTTERVCDRAMHFIWRSPATIEQARSTAWTNVSGVQAGSCAFLFDPGFGWAVGHEERRTMTEPKWKHDGVRVIPGHSLDGNTPQSPGMDRKAAINFARAGAQKLWAG